MKKFVSVSSLFLVFLMLGLQACMKDSTDPDNSDARSKYLGRWSVSETWHKSSYEATILADSNSTGGIFIQNFANTTAYTGNPAAGSISGNNISLYADQVIGDDWIINGGGTYDPETGKITFNYTIFDGATLITATAIYTK